MNNKVAELVAYFKEAPFKITVVVGGEPHNLWIDWDFYKAELAFSNLRDICFWNKWDFNECLEFIEKQGVSWIDVSNTMTSSMSIVEACDIAKNKNLNDE